MVLEAERIEGRETAWVRRGLSRSATLLIALMLLTLALAPTLAHATQVGWTTQNIDEYAPFFDGQPLHAASCTTSGFCAVVGQVAGRIETTTNPTGGSSAWTVTDLENPGLDGIACPTASLCVAVDDSGQVLASTDPGGGSSAWHTVATSSVALTAVSCYDSSRCVAVGGGEVLTSSAPASTGSWTAANVDSGHVLIAVSCPTATACDAVDSAANFVTSTNVSSTTPTWNIEPTGFSYQPRGISCPDSSLCVAVDDESDIARSTDPTAASPTWAVQDVSAADGLTGISCSSDSHCVAVDYSGQALVSQNPSAATPTWTASAAYASGDGSNLAGISCTSEPLCVAVDGGGNVLTATNPAAGSSAWTEEHHVEGTTRLDQGSCPTTTFCVIPDRIGKVLTSSNPTGGVGAWTAKDIDGTHEIFEVDCPSTQLCVGVDDAGNVLTSTDPTEGATATWSVGNLEPNTLIGFHSVSCAGPSLCVAVGDDGNLVTSTDPAAGVGSWSTPVSVDANGISGPYRIDCPSTQLCVAVDEDGNVVTSTNPTGGAGAWTVTDVDGMTPLYSITCHGPTLCLAGDSNGNVLSSVSPAGGAGAWSAPVSFGATRIFGLSCPATSFCLAADNEGGVYSTADPTGGASAWSLTADTGDVYGALGAVCPSTSLCIVPDYQSNIAVGILSAPSLTTGAASNVTATAATLNGTVNPNGSMVNDCHFDYGTDTTYGSTAPCVETVGNGTSAVDVHADITGLAPNTTYHVRLDISGDSGTEQGADVSFTTAAVAPTVTAGAASDVSGQEALLNGTVNPNDAAVTDCHFEYGTTTQYGQSTPCTVNPGSGDTAAAVVGDVEGLTPNTTYDFELVATNAGGTATATGAFMTQAIDTTITSGPDGPTNDPVATFTFTADPPAGATFLCSVDHATPSPCTSPFTTGHLADGAHGFDVRAVTPSGVQDPTPASASFVVDTVAPVTTLQVLGGQRGIAGAIHGTVTLGATASDPSPSSGGVSTHCELLSAADPAPASYAAMGDSCYLEFVSTPGSYVLYGASTDAVGNTEAVKSLAFTLLPEVDVYLYSLPSTPTWQRQPLFHFASSTAGAGFLCEIDNGGYTSCQSPWLSPAQNPGQHTFSVRALAPDGTESSPATYQYTINASEDATPGHCAVDPFVVDPTNANGGNTIGCGFGSCPPHVACSTALQACPYGAICTLRLTSHFEDDDPAITFSLLSFCENGAATSCTVDETGDNWDVQQRYGTTLPFPEDECQTSVLDNTTKGCDLTTSQALIGNGETTSPICYAQITNVDSQLLGPGDTLPRDFGPDSARRLDCDATESIAPASALDLASVAPASNGSLYASVVYIPTTGDLIVIQNGELGSRVGARAAHEATSHKRAAAPAITTIKLTVKHPGAVAVRFRLNTAAKQYLARHHKLSLKIKFKFTPPHQAAITKVHTITFTQPAKPPSAKQRKAKVRRLCLRKHPTPRKTATVSDPLVRGSVPTPRAVTASFHNDRDKPVQLAQARSNVRVLRGEPRVIPVTPPARARPTWMRSSCEGASAQPSIRVQKTRSSAMTTKAPDHRRRHVSLHRGGSG